jgi:hypothetical protein
MAHNRTERRIAIGMTPALGLLTVTPSPSSAATESLAATSGADSVGEGFLYDLSQDGPAPGDNYPQPPISPSPAALPTRATPETAPTGSPSSTTRSPRSSGPATAQTNQQRNLHS